MENIERRIEALERKVGWYRGLIVALGLILTVGVCMAAGEAKGVADVLRAKTLEIVNDKGIVVLRADAIEDKPNPHGGVVGGGRLALFDSKGREVLSAGPSLFGGTFQVNQTRSVKQDPNKKIKGRMTIFATDWGAMIALFDKDGRLMWKEPTGK